MLASIRLEDVSSLGVVVPFEYTSSAGFGVFKDLVVLGFVGMVGGKVVDGVVVVRKVVVGVVVVGVVVDGGVGVFSQQFSRKNAVNE